MTDAGKAERWANTTVHVTLDPSLAELDPRANDAVRAAFGTWLTGDVGLPHVVFDVATTRGAQAKDGVSRVLATRDVASGHENDVAYTVSYADSKTGIILEADVVFNLRYAFGEAGASCSDAWDLGAVATHETGHFFGLDEDMTEQTTTMWIRTNACDAHKRSLTSSDVASIEAVYEPAIRAQCALAPRSAPLEGAGWLAASAAALAIRRRRRA